MSSKPKPNSVKGDGEPGLVPKLRFPAFRSAPAWDLKRGDALFDAINNRSAAPGLPVLAITQEHGAIPRDHIDYHVSATAESIATYKEVCVGDFIISLRSFQGGIEYSRFHGICSPAYVILRRKGAGVDDYFRHLFKSARFIQQLNRNIEGLRDGKMISYAQFSEQLIPVPEPTEQEKLADCLTSVDELIAAHGLKLDALRAHRGGLLRNLFPAEGEVVPPRRFPKFQRRMGWRPELVDSVAKITTGDKDTQDKDDDGLYPFFVRSQEVQRINSYSYEGEAVLTSGDGVGVGHDFHYVNGRFDFHQRVYCLHGFRADVSARFFYLYFANRFGARVRQMSAKNSVDSVRRAMIAEMPIAIPDLDEQNAIADTVFELDRMIAAQSAQMSELALFKRALTQRLFPSAAEVQA